MNDEFIKVIKQKKKSSFGLFIDPILKWLAETLIPQSKERRWIFVYLCQSPWKSPSTSVIRCFLQLKRAMCRNHTHESRGGAFAGAPKGTQKLWTLSPVSQLGYPSPTTFSNPIESDTSHRGKKFPNLFFCTFLRGDRSYGYFITQWEKLPTFYDFLKLFRLIYIVLIILVINVNQLLQQNQP